MMVSFPRSGTQSDRVTLKGAKDCVEAAKKRIQEIIEDLVGAGELGAPLGHGGGGRPVRTLRRLPRQAASSRLRQQLTAQCVNARRVGGTSSPRALLPSSEGRERAGGGSSIQRGLVDPLLLRPASGSCALALAPRSPCCGLRGAFSSEARGLLVESEPQHPRVPPPGPMWPSPVCVEGGCPSAEKSASLHSDSGREQARLCSDEPSILCSLRETPARPPFGPAPCPSSAPPHVGSVALGAKEASASSVVA